MSQTSTAAPEGWVATPTHLLRWDCVRRLTDGWPPGRFVELGAGQGDFTSRFAARGFSGVCYDLGDATRAGLRGRFASEPRIDVADSLDSLEPASFDYLFAFEVLEHIPDDLEALRRWASLLRPGGRLAVSVPAHMRKFGPEDRFVGHVRRYERSDLEALLEGAGFRDVRVVNYGFPLTNLTRRVRSALMRPEDEVEGYDATERSIASGARRSRAVVTLGPLIRDFWLKPFAAIQRPLSRLDRGDGWVATAIR